MFCMDIERKEQIFALNNIKKWFYNRGGECLLRGAHRDLV